MLTCRGMAYALVTDLFFSFQHSCGVANLGHSGTTVGGEFYLNHDDVVTCWSVA